MEVAALRTLQPDPFNAALCLTVPLRWLNGLVACVAGRGRWNPWELDHVSVRGGGDATAEVTLRFASDDGTSQPSRREAFMALVMAVMDHLRDRWSRETEPEAET